MSRVSFHPLPLCYVLAQRGLGGIAPALQTRLSSFILSNPDQYNEIQPKQIRIVKVPEYFAEYREKGDGLAAFLGSSIVAKVLFSFCTKAGIEHVSEGHIS
jgi:hypothetical protein